jgi:hypothetical protein
MAGHVHAALMAEYAKDAADNERPWELWEYKANKHGCWVSFHDTGPAWEESSEYMRKPRTIKIGEVEIPEPVANSLPIGTIYCIPQLNSNRSFSKYQWDGDSLDHTCLRRGIIHLTEENAVLHTKALILASGGVV